MDVKQNSPLCPLFFFILATAAWCAEVASADAGRVFSVASYNVENLFDTTKRGTEYPDFRGHHWTEAMYALKLRRLSRVIGDLNADVIGLQEVESRTALSDLNRLLAEHGRQYPYYRFGRDQSTGSGPVACALFSRFPILRSENLRVGPRQRDILSAVVSVSGNSLYVYVNHWRSRRSPESFRRASARVLRNHLDTLPPGADVVVLGDFNTNDDAVRTPGQAVSGLCHVLGTWKNGRPVLQSDMKGAADDCRLLYNLWMELPGDQRWSHEYFGHRSSLDAVLVSPGLFDTRGIAYADASYHVFAPAYLFDAGGHVHRWTCRDGQITGCGYSDHLPVAARFRIGCFQSAEGAGVENASTDAPLGIASLYGRPPGPCRVRVDRCVVLLQSGDHAVLKTPGGRGIHVFRAARRLKRGGIYRLVVTRVGTFHGLTQVTGIRDAVLLASAEDLSSLYISATVPVLRHGNRVGEVATGVTGRLIGQYLVDDAGEQIRVYARKKGCLVPYLGKQIQLDRVRVGVFDGEPELVVEAASRISAP
ncbi:MAG: hypothetical protein CSA22_01250 [Deltaproteobacteria bacterium]|nr:MAG: hypothetical protein CSA22_01250 [Deltaproteobacteria bacterium]